MADASPVDGGHWPVAVIGGGQAGLSMSYYLLRQKIDHIVLEADRAGHEWTDRRWDTFCLVTPNWQCRLPGFPYRGPDPDGFMARDEVASYLDEYVRSYGFPLKERTRAIRLRRAGGLFHLTTTAGQCTAGQVVVATGPYQVPRTPRLAERLPEYVTQLHSADYRSPEQLPAGAVLVVGTGQSGCQIAEDLHLAGGAVHLSVGSAPRVARRYRGKDVVAWLDEMGYYRRAITDLADADAVRFRANHYVTGRDGGHDIDLRAFAAEGMTLHGRLTGVSTNGTLTFAADLERNLDTADAVSQSIKDSIDAYTEQEGIDAPREPRYTPPWIPPSDGGGTLDLGAAGVTSVVWATGFGADYRWIEVPVFDGRGYPTHRRGVTGCPGLYFLGLPWQHTWGSGRLGGVADDAEHLLHRVIAHGVPDEVSWIAGTPLSTYPARDDDWTAPRTVA
ncbi:MAG TPA: MSMEG_0569 family flavin-dependent oxidoreductase [Trebonia sp.]|nr:MSMEG_0569 family flavin-dependent oxidoreductase [Trebonia sp.]